MAGAMILIRASRCRKDPGSHFQLDCSHKTNCHDEVAFGCLDVCAALPSLCGDPFAPSTNGSAGISKFVAANETTAAKEEIGRRKNT